MDLKTYYRKIREVESTIGPPFVVVIGMETPEGGKEGTATQVTRLVAATLIAEGRARLASPDEAETFLERSAEARREAEANAAAQRMQVTIVGQTDLRPRAAKVPRG